MTRAPVADDPFAGLPAPLTARPAVNADSYAVKALVWATLREYGMEPDPAHADRGLDHIEESFSGGGLWLIEEADGVLIGTVGLVRVDETICELTKMFLIPEARGRGLGRLMLAAIIDTARSLGFRQMTLETDTSLKEAVKLYSAAGFEFVNECNSVSRCNRVMRLKLW